MLQFKIQFHNYGIRRKFVVPVANRAIVGVWHDGRPYAPCMESVIDAMPKTHEKALLRSTFWTPQWSDVMRLDMVSKRNSDMGSLFARAVWKEKRCRLEGYQFGPLNACAIDTGFGYSVASDCGKVSIQVSRTLAESRFADPDVIPVFMYS